MAYDLFSLSESRSPERTAHNVTVTLDRIPDSPFYKRIKRLGKTTPGRFGETLSQAIVVNSLLEYISGTQERVLADRQIGLRGGKWPSVTEEEQKKLIFRKMFIEDRDEDIVRVVFNFFAAVRDKWPEGWNELSPGLMLNRSNGFSGLMRFLRPAYNSLNNPGSVPTQEQFNGIFNRIDMGAEAFNTETFLPGSTGAKRLFDTLVLASGIVEI